MSGVYDVVVIGGGHAGAEAAWAASRLGASTALLTLDPSRIAAMSCNPAIGGLAKGQMVREIDALGGLMGIATDNTAIQYRMLNRSKGPAVWGPRAQSDKARYSAEVRRLLATCPNLDVIGGEVVEIKVEGRGSPIEDRGSRIEDRGSKTENRPPFSILHPPSSVAKPRVAAVSLSDGSRIACRAVVVTTGTFLRGLMHTGEKQTEGGRFGEPAANGLSASLAHLGLELGRLKTGTPPRLHRDSVDFASLEEQPGDEEPWPFSFLNEYGSTNPRTPIPRYPHTACWRPPLPQLPCHLTATSPAVHQIIRANLHRAPLYTGQIQSVGPRYCPSIEDKVVRFGDKTSHHIFLEPEGLDTPSIYCNGISTSLPADVQDTVVHMIRGLENARILRWGYAIEYDMVWPTQVRSTLQTKAIDGLFLAGQINGTSGYEEAAAQGLLAGINAARYAATGRADDADFVLGRDQAYIGVLIDDLVTKPPVEPYRMFTSRAEHRLHLRADNADQRLTPIGRRAGLVDDDRWARFEARRLAIADAAALLAESRIEGASAMDWLRRPESSWAGLCERLGALAQVPAAVGRLVEIRAKYEGYIGREARQIERLAQLEQRLIPSDLDYDRVVGLRNEAKTKLAKFTPRSLGQALRISGITPADVTVLAVHLSRARADKPPVAR
jgi:tRNA uridine 5-carboxymethylaminomethyl modification enzyme